MRLIALVAVAAAVVAFGFRYPAHYQRPPATAAATTAAPAIGWIDSPVADTIAGTAFATSGWALSRAGVRAVEIRIGDRRYPAKIGIARPDVAAVNPGYPDSAAAGFEFSGDFAVEQAGDLAAQQTALIVVVAKDGAETVLGRRTLVGGAAMTRWRALLDERPALASPPLRFLMMTSGVGAGGADGIGTTYLPYLSRTMQVGMAVPILYLRTTRGAGGDWVFDPDFDLSRKCRDRAIADDTLHGVIRHAIDRQVPVQFILNGGIWADSTCDTPEWDINDHLEANRANCQWTQDNEVLADDYLRNLPGSTHSPELARSLTYNVYASRVRHYKRRNLQAAATVVAAFAREHPDLFAGVVLDADTYMNPFVGDGRWYDYNPGMLKQFRHWLAGSGPYAGSSPPGVPDLSSYRRAKPLSLADVNRLARKSWKRWDEVDPPRVFPGLKKAPVPPGALPFWEDPWHVEWDSFRKHVIALHYDELSAWVAATGIPRDAILSAQAFIAPDPGNRPVSVHIVGGSPDYDSAGVSIEGAIPRQGRLGTILYGPAAENHHTMPDGHSLFATLARLDPGWGIVEYNATDLKHPDERPTYAQSYHTFRDLFNFDGSRISVMAWNGSNGLFRDQPGYVPFTSWRNTPGEDAMRDFLVEHADLPRGARLWTFGSPRHADADGWTVEGGTLVAGAGHVDLAFDGSVTLASPPGQVLRAASIETLFVGVNDDARPTAIRVEARRDGDAAWTAIAPAAAGSATRREAPGYAVPLAWPAGWRSERAIAGEIRVTLDFAPGTRHARVRRVMLYPRAPG